MEIKLISNNVAIYSVMDINSTPITIIPSGSYITIGKTLKKNDIKWIVAKTREGINGYILNVECVPIKKVKLLENKMIIYSEPSYESAIIDSLPKGFEFFIEELVENESGKWLSMHSNFINHGFISGDVKIKIISEDKITDKEIMNYFIWGSAAMVMFLFYINGEFAIHGGNSLDSGLAVSILGGKAAAIGALIGGIAGLLVNGIRGYFN